ncbi:formate/nitrite transporter family protein [Paracoccus sp. (in: a-proteobacteria)]|uniref:formate/nitrite transporter family protein n=1 Tax=Paracoccus sp. TaxID=267 RepID=UPI0026E0DE8B|nr:formate/nitrite transporter family protein [Paracoccus sp. (in: a-proteobacteria)]MDO5370304.1 formate/nitrite transporter family protein [Paracoccus sp. (in: a-proteobacteria)]
MSEAGTKIDDHAPPDLPAQARDSYGDALDLGAAETLVLGFLAGVFIAFGSIAFLVVMAVPEGSVPFGILQIAAGLAFSLGLLLVLVAGAELFTGNTLMLGRLFKGQSSFSAIGRAWALAWTGNLAGSVFVVVLFIAAGGHEAGEGLLASAALDVAGQKTAKSAGATFASGILANMLVCLAVWMSYAARTTQGKILALVPPIAAFVAAGLEHSVANMSLIPMGLGVMWLDPAAGADPSLGMGGMAANLFWATLGNILGGGLIAGCYWFAYDRDG